MADFALALHERRLRDFCVAFPYLSFAYLFGARACYLSFLAYLLSHPQPSQGFYASSAILQRSRIADAVA